MDQNEIMAELTGKLLAGLAGDGTAYADFLSQLSPILRRVIGRKIPVADVEDVLQEVLISIHKARHTYDGERPLLPWVLAIASFRMTDHLRKSYSQMRHQSVDIADYENVLSAVTENTDGNESIHEMLNGATPRERNILSLMHVEGYTAKQVGTRLGMNESAVKVAAHRAIKKIRERLGNG
ncbi:MAG: sigma-70 family RNA polymerase sigma factor [Bacteroidota bacterium]